MGQRRAHPLGNVTSQLFANIYLHPLDDFVKQTLRERYYLRYCDDFILLSRNKTHLESLITLIEEFLERHLMLELHPKKVTIRKLNQGIDFVDYVLFERYSLVRTRTKQRMKRRLKKAHEEYLKGKMDLVGLDRRVQSYLGVLSHANQHTLSQAIRNAYGIREGGQVKKGTRVGSESTPKEIDPRPRTKKTKKTQEPFPKAK